MALMGYFDESGTHGKESPVVIVAGFIASPEQWALFEHDLSSLLEEYAVKTFHAKDLRTRKGDFKGWPTIKRARFNSRFLRLADDHLSYGLSAVLRSEEYRSIYRATDFPPKARPDTQYGLCVRTALLKSLVLLKDRKDDWPLNVIFENGARNAGDAIRVFGEVKDSLNADYAPLLGKFNFGSKTDLPIAIADSLAYAIFRLSAGYSAHPSEPNAAVVGPADPPYYVSKIPLSRTLIDGDTLASLRDDLLAP
ncbi:DUF3800 domain-containing protein [Bradyrhizobium sp. SZCCHNR1070]|uniref:DUF3800 domain-containing protein n=1 Tax=Bradyrhizobium sp. SZCCHNR1070 TaxID=3057361 RepID=UPI002916AF6C|nr:DUF3800 domain-containing protein [Bradyrhizobium sp. SZCCHNR1070]